MHIGYFTIIAQQRRYNYNTGMETRKLYREMEDHINEKTESLLSLRSNDEIKGVY